MTNSSAQSSAQLLLNGATALTHLGVIQITGEDAAKFIHGQLTQDFALLGQDTARLAAFCSAKGRMQASFVGFKRPNGDILLVGSADIVAATAKRLAMFVMRAKAKVTDASEHYQVFGLVGSATKNIAGSVSAVWSKHDIDTQTFVNLYPALGVQRQLWIAPAEHARPSGEPLSPALWAWSEVQSGVATVTLPVVEAFVPQMLNFESIGGVNFKKGCYPGQEVMARSQFRGTHKRRAFVVHATATLATGTEVFAPDDDEQPAGVVVQAAPAPGGGFDAIVCAQISAAQAGGLQLLDTNRTQLELLPLPYPLLDDI